jgi:plasmid stabilization system protein ParE
MTYRLSVRQLAEDDLNEAVDFYENQQAGLGVRFHDEIALTLRQIAENPRMFPRSERSRFRKAALSKFPFCIYYCVIQDFIAIVAIHDARSDPNRWQSRVGDE